MGVRRAGGPPTRASLRTRAAVLLVAYDVAVLTSRSTWRSCSWSAVRVSSWCSTSVVLALSMGRDPGDALALLVVAVGGLALVDVRVDTGGLQVPVTRLLLLASA